MQVAGQTPEHLAQMQVGYRSALMDHANSFRDATNPFDATLGTPNARARLDTLYPGNAGNANLLRTRDLEGQLQRTSNDVLGGSHTAGRQIADRSFDGTGQLLGNLAEAGATAAMGGVPIVPIARTLSANGLRDFLKLGAGKSAVAKANELAPLLLNPDPTASSITVDDLLNRAATYDQYVRRSRPTRPLGMFGASLGIGVGSRL